MKEGRMHARTRTDGSTNPQTHTHTYTYTSTHTASQPPTCIGITQLTVRQQERQTDRGLGCRQRMSLIMSRPPTQENVSWGGLIENIQHTQIDRLDEMR
mmetsp:Transcript_5250/g.12371  ORF Transcript_5250/g.12371 Transcript_5250/m.12371 type:complete len:99 (-) Transcript_5250:739-1035(-)